jgi:hypothetical protein
MVVIRSLIFVFVLVFSTTETLHCQKQDTLSLIVKFPKAKRYSFGDQKMYLKLADGSILKDQNEVFDSILLRLNNSNTIYTKITNKSGHIFLSGKWNEAGFQDVIYVYNRRGKIKYTGRIKNGKFTKD